MNALVKSHTGLDGLRLEEIPIPTHKDDQLLVKVKACAICGTDLHIMYDEYLHFPPITLGHEFFGEVVDMGKDVKGFELGEQITSMTAASTCGQCPACKSGFLMRCEQRRSVGSGFNGAMAEYIVIPDNICYKIPKDKWDDLAMAICEPMACSAHAVFDQTEMKAGDIAVIMGPGAIGQGTCQMAKQQGAFVIVSGIKTDKERLDLALELGADVAVDDPANLKETVLKYAPLGADVVFECSGAAPALISAIDISKRGGQISQIGLFGKPITVNLDQMIIKEIRMNVSIGTSCQSWTRLMILLTQNKLRLDKLVSATFPLSEWEKGFDMTKNKEGYRIVLLPGM